jgi:hypothetical protein
MLLIQFIFIDIIECNKYNELLINVIVIVEVFAGCTWHHHQDVKTMMTVKQDMNISTNATYSGDVHVKKAEIIGFFNSPKFI